MSISRSVGIVISLACLLGMAVAADKPAAQAPVRAVEQAPALLPQQFGGWQMQGSPQISTDPATADPTNAAVLKEYRFTDLATANYTRDDGRTLKIRAARFADASGAFGAYTFYLQPEMTRTRQKRKKDRRSGGVSGTARALLPRERAGGRAVQPGIGHVGGTDA